MAVSVGVVLLHRYGWLVGSVLVVTLYRELIDMNLDGSFSVGVDEQSFHKVLSLQETVTFASTRGSPKPSQSGHWSSPI